MFFFSQPFHVGVGTRNEVKSFWIRFLGSSWGWNPPANSPHSTDLSGTSRELKLSFSFSTLIRRQGEVKKYICLQITWLKMNKYTACIGSEVGGFDCPICFLQVSCMTHFKHHPATVYISKMFEAMTIYGSLLPRYFCFVTYELNPEKYKKWQCSAKK